MKSMEPAMIVTTAAYNTRITISDSTPAEGVRPQPMRAAWAPMLGLWAILAACAVSPVLAADKNPNSSCLECHSDKTLSKTNAAGKEISLFIDETKFGMGVHKTNTCASCHADISSKHPDDTSGARSVNCGSCHDKEAKEYGTSIHGVSHKLGASGAANCSDCHGTHQILPAKHADSPVFKLNLTNTCANCHTNAGLTKEYQMKYPEAASQYMDSIHGRALLKMGLIVAPSCNDCHGVHDSKRAVDRDSPINQANVAKTCGKCHVGVEEIYNKSVHGQLLAKGDKRGPVCSDCHTAHQVETPKNGHFKMASDARCARCHEDRLPPSDPKSRLSKANILGTCKQCHPQAQAGFTEYKPHANPLDGKNYPLLH